MKEKIINKFGDNEYEYHPETGQWRPVSKPPEPDLGYLEEYSKNALAEMDREEERPEQIVAQSNGLIPDDEVHRGDFLYEEFCHIESWDDVVQAAADLSLDINENYFTLGKLVNFACAKRKPGRPGEEDRTVARLSGQINVNRSTLSMCAAIEEFYREIRDELPKQISLRQLNDARVSTGWKPGKEVEAEQLTLALNIVIALVEGKWKKPKKSKVMTPADYAKRIMAEADKAIGLHNPPENDLGDALEMFELIFDTAQSIVEVLREEKC